jgi:hypothetical protein
MHYFSNLFWCRTLRVSDRFTVRHQESSTVYAAIGICHTGYADCMLAHAGELSRRKNTTFRTWQKFEIKNKFLICIDSNKTNRPFAWLPANICVIRLCTRHKLCFMWGMSRGQRNSSPSERNNSKSVTKIQWICEEYCILLSSRILLEMLMYGTQKIRFVKFWADVAELYR